LLVYAESQQTSKAGCASTTSVFSGKLSKNDNKIVDPFDDDFDMEHVSQSNSSSQTAISTAGSAFDDEFAASTSQSQSSLALSAGN